MARKMQPLEQILEPKINFQLVVFLVEKVLGECNFTIKPNACHY
jgi:hypothetical protein